jgi:hypothetical protein
MDTGVIQHRYHEPVGDPHFGRGKEVNNCIKKLLEVMHGGILWLDTQVSIDVDLIAKITGLPTNGEQPTQYLDDKTKEKALEEEMKQMYGTERGSRGIIINQISEPTTRLATKLMACKLLRKCRKEEVPAGVIAVVVQCVKGHCIKLEPILIKFIFG